MTCATNPSEESLFTTVSEAFVQAVREGKAGRIEDYAARYPDLAERIMEEFPLIELAEQLNFRTKQETQSPPLPSTIGKYRIKCEIGRGGMGRVYAASLPPLSREYAIKVISVKGSDSRDSLIRFQREAKSVGKLTHPNIIPVCDYGVHEGLLYFVMPRIKGLDLSKVIDGLALERSRASNNIMAMDWQMVAKVGAQVASALDYAHKKGLVHRDIKPANLIMESNGHTWVSDFGLVKNLLSDQSLSNTGDLIGTPRYMAPEQLRGVCDERSDIYGLGLTLFELASGCRAWENMSGYEIVAKRSLLELPSIRSANPAIPESLCDIIMKCCAFKPDDRYQSAKEVHFVLERYLSGHKVGDRRRMRNAERSILKRRPIRLARSAATLVGIGVFAGGLYVITNRPQPVAIASAETQVSDAQALSTATQSSGTQSSGMQNSGMQVADPQASNPKLFIQHRLQWLLQSEALSQIPAKLALSRQIVQTRVQIRSLFTRRLKSSQRRALLHQLLQPRRPYRHRRYRNPLRRALNLSKLPRSFANLIAHRSLT